MSATPNPSLAEEVAARIAERLNLQSAYPWHDRTAAFWLDPLHNWALRVGDVNTIQFGTAELMSTLHGVQWWPERRFACFMLPNCVDHIRLDFDLRRAREIDRITDGLLSSHARGSGLYDWLTAAR